MNNLPGPGVIDDAVARQALGADYALWVRAGQIAERAELPFSVVWRAAQELRNAGFALRERAIRDAAQRAHTDHQAYLEQVRQLHQRRSTHGSTSDDESGNAE